ncbi:MAG: Nitrile hydratase [Acidimicrobiales bacterium]|nr:Nitrile hydratase [Acidimicrobiales bacterium]
MDGIHDMGGMEGFGPVVTEADELPFHEPWEGRVHGVMLAYATKRGIANFRSRIETMGNDYYLASPYYEHWLHAVEDACVEHGDVQRGEVEARAAAGAVTVPRGRSDPDHAEMLRSIFRPFKGTRDPAPEGARFRAGDRVRVVRTVTHAHNRVPRYVRGVAGIVESVAGGAPLEEGPAYGDVMAVYHVEFAATALWGDGAERGATVIVDVYEKYLEPAS